MTESFLYSLVLYIKQLGNLGNHSGVNVKLPRKNSNDPLHSLINTNSPQNP